MKPLAKFFCILFVFCTHVQAQEDDCDLDAFAEDPPAKLLFWPSLRAHSPQKNEIDQLAETTRGKAAKEQLDRQLRNPNTHLLAVGSGDQILGYSLLHFSTTKRTVTVLDLNTRNSRDPEAASHLLGAGKHLVDRLKRLQLYVAADPNTLGSVASVPSLRLVRGAFENGLSNSPNPLMRVTGGLEPEFVDLPPSHSRVDQFPEPKRHDRIHLIHGTDMLDFVATTLKSVPDKLMLADQEQELTKYLQRIATNTERLTQLLWNDTSLALLGYSGPEGEVALVYKREVYTTSPKTDNRIEIVGSLSNLPRKTERNKILLLMAEHLRDQILHESFENFVIVAPPKHTSKTRRGNWENLFGEVGFERQSTDPRDPLYEVLVFRPINEDALPESIK